MNAGPRWTGHVLVDVGVAALCAMRAKARPEDLTVEDLDEIADEIERAYALPYLNAYLTCLFPNGAFTNPTMREAARALEAERALRSHRSIPLRIQCALTGAPAVTILDRRHLPLMSGAGVFSFTPGGLGGLPVAGWVPLAVHVFALGSRRAIGRALAVHADDPAITLYFAKQAVEYNRRQIALAAQVTDGKYPDAKAPLTLVIATLRRAAEAQREALERARTTSIVVYHLTNSGQGADLDIYALDSSAVRFVLRAGSQKYRAAFDAIVSRGWRRELLVDGKGKKKVERVVAPSDPDPTDWRNYAYEDLFALPGNAMHFVRVHLLGGADARKLDRLDPRSRARTRGSIATLSWGLTDLFLTEVLRMEKKRIDAIRVLGDRIAARVASEGDRRLLQVLLLEKSFFSLRARLIKASAQEVKAGRPPLIGMDEFLLIFEQAEELARADWTLARDLLCIRVLEMLHAQGYFRAHAEVLKDLGEETDDESGSPIVEEGARA